MPQFLCALWPDIGPCVVSSLLRAPVRRCRRPAADALRATYNERYPGSMAVRDPMNSLSNP